MESRPLGKNREVQDAEAQAALEGIRATFALSSALFAKNLWLFLDRDFRFKSETLPSNQLIILGGFEYFLTENSILNIYEDRVNDFGWPLIM